MMRNARTNFIHAIAIGAMLFTSACAMVDVPDSRNVNIPTPVTADSRKKAINERPDSVMYLPLGEDVLVPEASDGEDFPKEMVGPFELRGETLAGALQLILADYDISLAFETQEGLTRRITVANLRGDLGRVVHQVCSLANLYCAYEDGTITVKDRQTFTVTLPPLGSEDDAGDYLSDIAEGLGAILENGADTTGSTTTASEPIVDNTTRTIVYTATQRTADIANRYFQRLRANTAMIVFETYIWEVSLNSGNSTGIDWSTIDTFGKFNTSFGLNGSVGADFLQPISIGLPTTQDINGTPTDLIQFLSQFGAVKTISQPQITVLSGSEAELRVADTQNYVSQIATTLDEGQSTTSVNTDSVDTGFTLTIGSSWDKATVYANVAIELTDVKEIENFAFADTGDDGGQTQIQLPQTSERQLSTQIRVRPGDSVLIAGLVRENDNFNKRGLGLMEPIIPDSRTAQTENLELVILLRPRVIVYTASNDKRYIDYAMKKHKLPGTGVEVTSPKELGEPAKYKNVPNADAPYDAPATKDAIVPMQETIPDGVPAPLTAAPKVERVGPAAAPVTGYVPPVVEPVKADPLPPPMAAPTPAPAPVYPAPVSIVPPAASAPAAVTPSWDQGNAAPPSEPAPILTQAPGMSDGSRFRMGSGYVSKSTTPAPAPVASPVYAAPAATPAYVAPEPSAIPLYNPNAAAPVPTAPSTAPSMYETYDYYTPAR
jgi:hypothetical protein